MAGIGFELRTLFQGKGMFRKVNAVLISSFVTIGPSLVCIGTLAALQIFMRRTSVGYLERELFLSLLTYAFIFSLVLTGGFAMTASRHVSNLLFKHACREILPALHGYLLLTLALVGTLSALFLSNRTLPDFERVSGWFLIMLLSAIWIETTFLSAVRGHRYLATAFVLGMLTGAGIAVSLLFLHLMPASRALLLGMDIGFALVLGAFHQKLLRSFGRFRFTLSEGFAWLTELEQYPELPFIGLLYYLGLYSHNFTYWAGSTGRWLAGGFRFSPGYDMPSFFAVLSIFPALVYLVVRFETSLALQCRTYYEMASGKGSIQDIRMAGRRLVATVESELQLFVRLQLIITLIALVMGVRMLPLMGASFQVVDVFSALVLGNFGFVCLYAVCLILLYLDDRKGTLLLLGLFNLLSIGFSWMAQWLGDRYQGAGYAAAAMVTLCVSIVWLARRLGDLDYLTFALQPVYRRQPGEFFRKIRLSFPRKE